MKEVYILESNTESFWEWGRGVRHCLWQASSLLLEKGPIADLGRVPQAEFYQTFGLRDSVVWLIIIANT